MICVSILCAIICIINSYKFYKKRTERYIEIRKPISVLLYCIFGSFPSLFIIIPLKTLIEIYNMDGSNVTDWFFQYWLLTLLQEFVISTMSICIALRCWLLYYDHSYEISIIDKNWKGIINATEQDFWLSHRKTCGDLGFVFCIGFIVANIELIILSICGIFALQSGNLFVLNLMSLFIEIVTCSFIFFLIFQGKNRKLFIINSDKFVIIKELQYLSFCTILVIIAYILELLIDIVKFALIIETGQILFVFITSWIQNYWVVKQCKKVENDSLLRSLFGKNNHPISTKSNNSTKDSNVQQLEMIDVLRNKYGFGMFMRHCQQELNVEGLLFIVEVAQYKAKLSEDEAISIMLEEMSSTNTNTNTMSTLLTGSGPSPSPEPPSTSNGGRSYKLAIPTPTVRDNDQDMNITLPPLSSMRETDKKLAYEKYQSNVLSKDWNPIANKIFSPDKKDKGNHKERQFEVTKFNSENVSVLYMYDDDDKYDENEDEMTPKYIYEYAQYLFLKYIDAEAEFGVNVGYKSREELLLFFSKTMDKGFEYVLNKYGITISVMNSDDFAENYDEYISKFKQFLYFAFDDAVSEVWNLLSKDSFIRFTETTQYKYLLKKYQQHKLQLS